MIIQTKDLKDNMSVIYKINYNNGNFYIGITNNLKRRISQHVNAWKKNNVKKVQDCDQAIYEQGGLSEIEVLEFVPNIAELEEREIYWINYYDAYNSPKSYNNTPGGYSGHYGEKSSVAVFTNNQVLDIRKRRYFGERKKDVYKDYQNYNFQTFERVWLGRGYPNVGTEYLIETNSISRQEYSHKANSGINNGRAKCSKEQIMEIRKRYDEQEPLSSIVKDFSHISKSTVRRIALRESYKDIV